MATSVPSGFGTRSKPSCDARPACPACDGLECLCRPRFFAGQLLTEEDLNRLDQYVVAKNRLHNRYLVGWGVACGLEVVCSICEPNKARGRVTVRPGYAVSPCGNDIVVCGDSSVDVCELISRCKPEIDLCLGPSPDAGDCGGVEQWILAICYTEKPSRGVTALLNSKDANGPACGCGGGKKGCGCGGGSKGGGCGCGGGSKSGGCGCGTQTQTKAPKKPAPQCEPTLICEGYTFTAWKVPSKSEQEEKVGAVARRFGCCWRSFVESLSEMPENPTTDQLATAYYDVREALRSFILDEGLYDCQAAAKLALSSLPPNATAAQITAAIEDLASVAGAVLLKCYCSALLPPCPDPAGGDCVPLATLKVQRNPCNVLEICNLSARKFLLTIPNIVHWVEALTLSFESGNGAGNGGLLDAIRARVERACCGELGRALPPDTTIPSAPPAAGPPTAGGTGIAGGQPVVVTGAGPQGPGGPTGKMVLQALSEPGRFANVPAMVANAVGFRDSKGQPLVSAYEMAHPTDFLLAHQVLAPLLRSIVPFDIGAPASARTADPTVAELSRQVADLTRAVEELRKNR